uniref:Uncharacterized protein n=1 Tax=Pavo cristatus TaxID=9049 RepID=A0A8C9FDB0_PAVCR
MYELYDPCTVMFFFRYTVVLEYNSTECVLVQYCAEGGTCFLSPVCHKTKYSK